MEVPQPGTTYGVKVVVRSGRFEEFADRLLAARARPSTLVWRGSVESYLANRCGKPFLIFAFGRIPELFAPSHFSSASESGDDDFFVLAARMHSFGILPPALRDEAISRVTDYSTLNLPFLDEAIAKILTPEERAEILDSVAGDYDRNPRDFRSDLVSNYDTGDGSAEDDFQPFFDYADELLERFADDPLLKKSVERHRDMATDVAAEIDAENARSEDDRDDDARDFATVESEASGDQLSDRTSFTTWRTRIEVECARRPWDNLPPTRMLHDSSRALVERRNVERG